MTCRLSKAQDYRCSAHQTPLPLQLPQTIGQFEFERLIGAGTFGEVYFALDKELDRPVAIKVLKSATATEQEVERLKREARLMAAAKHENVCCIFSTISVNDRLGIVMEFVEGRSLADDLSRGLTKREVLTVALQIASGLSHVHDRGIAHRDIKPGNIRLGVDGAAKIVDFGLGAFDKRIRRRAPDAPTEFMTTEGTRLGTAPYMSPEQVNGESIDHRSDIWAFGCVLFEMLTGRRAFPGTESHEIWKAILELEPDYTGVLGNHDERVIALVKRCLIKDRGRRLQSAAEAVSILSELLSPIHTLPETEVSYPWGRRVAISLGAVACVLAIARTAPMGAVELAGILIMKLALAAAVTAFAIECDLFVGGLGGPRPSLSAYSDRDRFRASNNPGTVFWIFFVVLAGTQISTWKSSKPSGIAS